MIRPMQRWNVFAYLSLVLFAASVAWGRRAQARCVESCSIQRAAVVGAQITLVNAAQGLQRATHSNNSGEYEFVALPPGTYALTAEKEASRSTNGPA